jgi:predicted lipoprotein with Yx(FWY)xxD motif
MRMRSGRRSAWIKSLVVVAVLGLTAAACSDDGEPASPTQAPSPTEESEAPSPTEEPAGATVEVEASDLGDIVVDAEGRTLYVFLADEGSDSTCYEDCEAAWPPLTVDGEPVAGEGIDASLLGTSERTDGSAQVTLDGHPLYHFAQDATPDDVNGQGVGDVWYVVSPEGAPIQ